MSTCATCPRPADPRRGVCQPCYERELIRGARLRWESAAEWRAAARKDAADTARAALEAAIAPTGDRAAWLRAYGQVENKARDARHAAESANRLHGEAGAMAIELWQLRGRVGVPALRPEELPDEEAAP